MVVEAAVAVVSGVIVDSRAIAVVPCYNIVVGTG
jgi:hypothetical protein